MHLCHGGDHCDIWGRHFCKWRDFAGMVHADFDHRKFRIRWHPRKR